MKRGVVAGAAAALGLLFVLIVGVPVISGGGAAALLASQPRGCGAAGPAVTVDPNGLPAEIRVGNTRYRGEQIPNAATIMQAAKDKGLDVRGQTVGVMTAIGESTLINIDRGDAVGPDSRGLFQQRANGAWGSYADRMNPYTAASNFFAALLRVPGWETLPPTLAAHRTQRNADPNHYARFWDDAVAIVQALSGDAGEVIGVVAGAGNQVCTDAAPGSIPADGWIRPTTGRFTSPFGMRWGKMHNGVDIAPPCETPIYAAGPGAAPDDDGDGKDEAVVIRAGASSGYGNLIVLDHGGGVLTRYAHMATDDVLVAVGDTVDAGDQIARVGNAGQSTGCHLHFEVQTNGAFTNPVPWMTARGVALQDAA